MASLKARVLKDTEFFILVLILGINSMTMTNAELENEIKALKLKLHLFKELLAIKLMLQQ